VCVCVSVYITYLYLYYTLSQSHNHVIFSICHQFINHESRRRWSEKHQKSFIINSSLLSLALLGKKIIIYRSLLLRVWWVGKYEEEEGDYYCNIKSSLMMMMNKMSYMDKMNNKVYCFLNKNNFTRSNIHWVWVLWWVFSTIQCIFMAQLLLNILQYSFI